MIKQCEHIMMKGYENWATWRCSKEGKSVGRLTVLDIPSFPIRLANE